MLGGPARWAWAVVGAFAGFYVGLGWLGQLSRTYPLPLSAVAATGLLVGMVVVAALCGYVLGPVLNRLALLAWRRGMERVVALPGVDVLAGSMGAVFGLVAALLLHPALAPLGWPVQAVVSVALGLLGWTVFVHKRADWRRLWRAEPAVAAAPPEQEDAAAPAPGRAAAVDGRPKVLDTSAIVDGRVTELYRTGFLEGPVVVPNCVLDELRHIADSADELRRQRGRHGLEVLAMLQKELGAPVRFEARDPDPTAEVDAKLVRLARELGGHVVTTDFNLNKVAELQGVSVLNVNALASALRPRYLPGEEMTVRVVSPGKMPGQGLAYLEDGTMVVVDGGRRLIGGDVNIVVTSSVQTAQGRMIFGRPNQPAQVNGS